MKASILDLRYKMNEVLKALDRNETVEILYHGKKKGLLLPYHKKRKLKVNNHPLFGMCEKRNVTEIMDKLRGGRYRDL